MKKIIVHSVLSYCDDLGVVQQWFLTKEEADAQADQIIEEGFDYRGGGAHEVPVTSPKQLVES